MQPGQTPDGVRAPRVRAAVAASSTRASSKCRRRHADAEPALRQRARRSGRDLRHRDPRGRPRRLPAAGLRRPHSLHEGHAHRQRLHREVRARRRPGDPSTAARRRVLPGRHQPRRQGHDHGRGHRLLADLRRRRRGCGRDLRHGIPPGVPAPARPGDPRLRLRRRQAGVRSTPARRCVSATRSSSRPASCWTVAAHRAPPTPSTATARRRAATA